ncbi:MAG TPA: tetratricopeptide repeat protein [Myxococcota bacterium]|nr:tetratricopeptide repeat protein [Myxococcota bacterium]HRY96339.1 tetratricopeptide repeat protein [Myxococcota bacterium]HSA24196.1 tetratricopeptide repeat protein [Myxococcota bacterium]
MLTRAPHLVCLICLLAGCGSALDGPDPRTAEGRFELGQKALMAGQAGQAAEHAREATRLRPAWAPAHTLLGQALRAEGTAAGDRAEEVRAFERAVELQPGSAVAWANLVAAYRRAGQERRAAEALERLQTLGTGQPWAAALAPAEPAPNPNQSSGGSDGDRGVAEEQP